MLRGLGHLCYGVKLRELGVLSMEKGRIWETFQCSAVLQLLSQFLPVSPPSSLRRGEQS